MKYIIIAFCVLIIIYAILILIKSLINMSKGQCCEGCDGCPSNHICSSNPDNIDKNTKDGDSIDGNNSAS